MSPSYRAAPHLQAAQAAPFFSWAVLAALAPATAWGILLFGRQAALVLAVSTGAAVIAEAVVGLARGRFTLHDGTALLTGLLLGLSLPPGAPLYVPASAAAFAIAVVKQSFGGLGGNWMNPALAGRAFAGLSWASGMSAWKLPRFAALDAVSAATPLGALASVVANPAAPKGPPLRAVAANGYSFSKLDATVVGWINTHLLSPMRVSVPGGAIDLLLGNHPGSIGEGPALLLLGGAAFLIAIRVIRWEIPASLIGVFALLTLVLGGLPSGAGLFRGGLFFHLFTGGLILCAFFMATDPVTSPLTRWARLGYGATIGAVTFLLRFYGSVPEGVGQAVLLANCLVVLVGERGYRHAPRGLK